MLIAHMTDLHICAAGALASGSVDTGAYLERAVAHVNRLRPRPDAIFLTGDLVDQGSAAEYARLRAMLDGLDRRYFLIPGNHDDRDQLRTTFRDVIPTMPPDGFIQYAFALGSLHVIALDTLDPGSHGGRLCDARLDWIARQMRAMADRPVLVMMHHPPFATGIEHMDHMGLAEGAGQLGAIVADHGNVVRILCGHVHRPIVANWHGTTVSTTPSTSHQVGLTLVPGVKPGFVYEPPCVQLHLWTTGDVLVSHTSYVDTYETVARAPSSG